MSVSPSGATDLEDADSQPAAASETREGSQRISQLEASFRELEGREARLRRALHAGRMGTWEWDVTTSRVSWSSTLESIHGIPEGSFAGTFEAYQQDIHPEDRERVLGSIQATGRDGGSDHFLQYRIVRPDGEVRWLEAHGHVEYDAAGAATRVAGVCMDITDRKRLEQEREASSRRKARLVEITAAIAAGVTDDEVFAAVVDQVGATVGASSAGLWLVDPDRKARLVRAVGYREETRQALARLSIDASPSVPAIDAIRTGHPVWIASQEELLRAYPHLAAMVTPGRAYRISCLPILAHGEVIGVLGFTFDDGAPADVNEQNFLRLVASYCAQALERSRLLEAERRSRAQAEASAARMALLSRASRAFSEVGTDFSALLRAIVHEVNAAHADACGIVLRAEQGDDLIIAAVEHRDPEGTALARALLEASPLKLGQGISGRVAADGQLVFIPQVDPSLFDGPEYADYRSFFTRCRPTSLVAVPLRVRGRVLGTLSAVRDQDASHFNEEDSALIQELADRAALAIDNSVLHRDNRQARTRAELLYRLAAGLIGAEHLDELFQIALDGLESALGATRSSILAYDADGVIRFKAWRGLSEEYRSAVEGHSPWPQDAHDPQPIVIDDVEQDDALAAFVPVFRQAGIRAVGFIPLVGEGHLIGKFMVYYSEPRAIASHELEMARAIANHVAAAIIRFAGVAELERTIRFNEMFTGMLGHDLRNPLGAVMNAAELALLREDNPRVAKPLGRIVNAASRMSRMIDQLLDFTRVRVGSGIPLERRPCDLLPLLRQVADEIRDARPECTLRVEPAGDTTGDWDADRLAQVLSNLLANAVHHGVAEHGCTVRVDGTADDQVLIEVHNHGTIPPAVLPSLFEPMTGGERRGERSQGLGLGLFISRQIVHSHGGHIEVRSTEETGTTFTLTLPRHPAADEGAA
jgi:PAS domain S-box-containing protein